MEMENTRSTKAVTTGENFEGVFTVSSHIQTDLGRRKTNSAPRFFFLFHFFFQFQIFSFPFLFFSFKKFMLLFHLPLHFNIALAERKTRKAIQGFQTLSKPN